MTPHPERRAEEDVMHTPGPWRLRELANDTLAVYGKGEYDIVFPKRGGPLDADARLIAAAPDLLAALKQIDGLARQAEVYHARLNASEAFAKVSDIARAALARAGGQQ
jgi:hypothetical protein